MMKNHKKNRRCLSPLSSKSCSSCQRFALLLFLFGVFWATNLFAFESESGVRRGNPFSLPEGVVSRSKLSKKDDKEKLTLQAITVANGEKRIASISGENFVEGDEVNGRKIIVIGSDFVILERGPEKMKLTLERRPFSVQVNEEPEKLETGKD